MQVVTNAFAILNDAKLHRMYNSCQKSSQL